MIMLFVCLLTCVASSSSDLSLKLPLVVAATRVRYTDLPTLQKTFLAANAVMALVPAELRSGILLEIQDAEERCTAILTELYLLSSNRDRYKLNDSTDELVRVHKSTLVALEMLERSLKTASKTEERSLAKQFEDLALPISRMRSRFSDVRKLIKSKKLTSVVGECISELKSVFNKIDDLEGHLPLTNSAAVVTILARPLKELFQVADGLCMALRKLSLLEFQSEMQHLEIRSRPRVQSLSAFENEKIQAEAKMHFKLSVSTAVAFGRRLDVLIGHIPSFTSVIAKRVTQLYRKKSLEADIVEMWVEHMMADSQQSYVDLLAETAPSSLPAPSSDSERRGEISLIRNFVTRYVSVCRADQFFSALHKLL